MARQPWRRCPLSRPDALGSFPSSNLFFCFPQVNKSEQVEPAKSTKTIATAETTISAALAPEDKATHLVATSEGLGADPCPAGPQAVPCSAAVSVMEPTPAPWDGNGFPRLQDVPSTVRAETLLDTPLPPEEGGRSLVPEVQPDAALGQVNLEGPEPHLGSQRRQGGW